MMVLKIHSNTAPFLLALSLYVSITGVAPAEVIDFESGFSDGQQVTTVVTPSNVVTFSVTGNNPGIIHQVGSPVTAFVPNDDPVGGFPGNYFLSDTTSTIASDYFFMFDIPILSLSLDLYDFEAEGRTATLALFSDVGMTQLITQTTTGGSSTDGGIVILSIPLQLELIRSASLTFDIDDNGTGIDNVSFVTAPEPSVAVLLSLSITLSLLRKE